MVNVNCIIGLARATNILVATENAYDVIDALKMNPDQYLVYFYEVARLAAKLVKDIEPPTEVLDNIERALEAIDSEEKKKKILDILPELNTHTLLEKKKALLAARKTLLDFRGKLEEAINCLEQAGEEERRRLVLIFAALAVAPDRLAHQVASILHRTS